MTSDAAAVPMRMNQFAARSSPTFAPSFKRAAVVARPRISRSTSRSSLVVKADGERLNVVMVGAECAPFSKTAGLGDVMSSLPKVRVVHHPDAILLSINRAIVRGSHSPLSSHISVARATAAVFKVARHLSVSKKKKKKKQKL